MLTGMLAVKNLLDDQQNNLWMVNAEEEYHEIISDELDIPFDDVESVWDAVAHVFPRLDPSAFGIAAGLAAGLGLWLATIVLVLKGGLEVGPRLGLLNQFFPGYSVTPIGSFIGLGYGFLSGFIGGFGIAFMRNSIMFLYMVAVERRAEFQYLRRIWDYI